ncbi:MULTISPECIES: hypothetical protein [unclassified Afipia]|uniref:hypothetical protein n=1 Tax=unclassified Afipia TaxID=2642050 RepID=UPI000467E4F6|nr:MULTISPECIES: hypothetical protein [unclassified Afipia]
MSIEKIHLRKLLRLFYAKPNIQRRILLEDVRTEEKKDLEEQDSGGDFHGPFWADAKNHVAGTLDLREQTKIRVASNKTRQRLYPLLTNGFLSVWEGKIRWRNEKFEFNPKTAKGQFSLDELGAIVKVENILAVKIWDGTGRAIYPYFAENPVLPIEGARLGFWAMQEALMEFGIDDFRILDVLRGAYFRPVDIPLQGNERVLFIQKYRAILTEWKKIRDERG